MPGAEVLGNASKPNIPMNARGPTKGARPIARGGRHALRMNLTF